MNNQLQNKFTIGYRKLKNINISSLEETYVPTENDTLYEYNPFKIEKIQQYNPIYESLFTLSSKNYNNIQLNHKYHFVDDKTVVDCNNEKFEKDIFIKYSPVIDPLRYMVGKYETQKDLIHNLPYPSDISCDISHTLLPKIKDFNNCSYVDTFFYYISSMVLHHHNVCNCIDFFGSFLGIQDKFKYNVSDDIDYMQESDFFNENIDTLYTLENVDSLDDHIDSSRKKRSKLHISKSNHNISVVSLSELITEIPNSDENIDDCLIYDCKFNVENPDSNNDIEDNQITINDDSSSDDSSIAYTTDSDTHSSWETDDESENDSSISDTDDDSECNLIDEEQHAYIHNFPIQMISLEKCDGTLDQLFTNGTINSTKAASALFQVIMTLLIYQKLFHFTHNDLHTNNIMYIETDIEFLYYKFNDKTYKVPTYGKIYKIIDFGRSIYKFNGKVYCSDSFGPDGDANSQYNCEPFFNDKKPRLEPNMSFDLCRLGCSIYDFIIPDHLPYSEYDELQKTVYRWCLDDNKKNILYKKNGEERYPEFKLYKMIARTVHNHTPDKQLEFSYFNQFVYNSTDAIENLIDINKLPIYT